MFWNRLAVATSASLLAAVGFAPAMAGPAPAAGGESPRVVWSEGTVASSVSVSASSVRTAAVSGVRAALGPAKPVKFVWCGTYGWANKAGFICGKVKSVTYQARLSGNRVFLQDGGVWKPFPYRYNAAKKVARIDPALIVRPALVTAPGSTSWVPIVASQPHWNKCTPKVTWRVDMTALTAYLKATGYTDASAAAFTSAELARLTSAINTVGTAAGLNMVYDGTGIFPISGSSQPQDSAKSAPDLLVTFGSDNATGPYKANLPGNTVGKAGSAYVAGKTASGMGEKIVSSFMMFDYRYVAISAKNPFKANGVDANRMLYMHEMGHAVGLGHSPDPMQMMTPQANPQVDDRLGAGDRLGLATLASGECFTS
jgi:Matrixin